MFLIPSNTKVTIITPADIDPKGICIRIKFPSGRLISVIKHEFSYGGQQGLWEYMIVENESYFSKYSLDTEPKSVVGYQTDEDIQKILEEILKSEVVSPKLIGARHYSEDKFTKFN